MKELIWLNGTILPLSEATIGVEDRGYQFADGVYEVIRVYHGVAFTLEPHLDRLTRSAAGIRLMVPMDVPSLATAVRRLIEQSQLTDGMVYLQLTRGTSPRNHVFAQRADPTLLFYTRALPPVAEPGEGPGVKLHPVEDERWKRCWIKSIALLPNVLAKNEAIDAGCDEAVYLDEQIVSECSTSNVYAVIGGSVRTCPVGSKVLPGITRQLLVDSAAGMGVRLVETSFSQEEAIAADEIFITSTTREVAWVSHWGGATIGTGACGPVTRRLHEAIKRMVDEETGPVHNRLADAGTPRTAGQTAAGTAVR